MKIAQVFLSMDDVRVEYNSYDHGASNKQGVLFKYKWKTKGLQDKSRHTVKTWLSY